MNNMYDKQLVFESMENAMNIAKILVAEGYVIMLSKEEQFIVLNYLRTFPNSDRNCVVFMDREEFEEEFFSKSVDNE